MRWCMAASARWPGGLNVIDAGSGDTISTGNSPATISGGANIFSFVSTLTHGNADVIADVTASDVVYLTRYGSGDTATALGAAVSFGGSTTITLSDNTRITFLGIGSASALQGQVFSS